MPALAGDLALARTNFVVFAETVISDEKTGRPIRFAPHHRAIIDMIDLAFEEGRYLFCIAPIRHGKTSVLESLVLFILGQYPNTRCKIVCANQDRAKERVNKIRKGLLRNGRYRGIFPGTRVAGKGRVDRIHLERADGARDPALDACGTTTGIEGASVDLLCLDDCDDRRSQVSASRREEVRLAVTETFLNRLEPGSNVVAIATRWSPEDLFGTFTENEEACTRWTCFQEDIPDDLGHINAAEIGAGRVFFLPIGWQTALLPQPAPAATDDDDEECIQAAPSRPPPPSAPDPARSLRVGHEAHIRFRAVRGVPLAERWANDCPLCHRDGRHRKFQAPERRHLVKECADCQTAFAQAEAS